MAFFSQLMAISCAAVLSPFTAAFTTPFTTCITKGVGSTYPSTSLNVFGGSKSTGQSSSLSPLPRGISPFEKSLSKNIDIQAEFRKRAKIGIDAALSDGVKRIEIEFPPLLGGSQSKSQFDDFGKSKIDICLLLQTSELWVPFVTSFTHVHMLCSLKYE